MTPTLAFTFTTTKPLLLSPTSTSKSTSTSIFPCENNHFVHTRSTYFKSLPIATVSDTSSTITRLFAYNNNKKFYNQPSSKEDENPHWYPLPHKATSSEEKKAMEDAQNHLEELAIEFLAHQITSKLNLLYPPKLTIATTTNSSTTPNNITAASSTAASTVTTPNSISSNKMQITTFKMTPKKAFKLTKGRFLDLTSNGLEGEGLLEQLIAANISYNPVFLQSTDSFYNNNDNNDPTTNYESLAHTAENIVKGGIMALQSLLILGMQLGVKGSPFMQNKRVAHLRPSESSTSSSSTSSQSLWTWTNEDIKQLKHDRNSKAAIQLLSKLKKKQSAQGAFDLLHLLQIWNKHENLDLLRSGFPTRFTEEEELAANQASTSTHDPDLLLNIRKDLRRLKVYTIDAASTSEIDDGISIQVLHDKEGEVRQRFWIHIADADRWAPRGSNILQCAQRRATSIYLPTGSYPMFPPQMSVKSMSLNANYDSCALSLGVELNPDGSIDENSIVVTPSLITVSYRLTYDDVDEMLEEGVGYSEEWQLGALLAAANKRRKYRSNNGSSEGMIPNPIPQGSVSVTSVNNYNNGYDVSSSESSSLEKADGLKESAQKEGEEDVIISVNVESTHNAGMNATSTAETVTPSSAYASPVSPANLLVTEMMILGGEAIGKWGLICKQQEELRQQQQHQQHQQQNDDEEAKTQNTPKQFLQNDIELPFRSQLEPEFRTREREANFLEDLKEENAGNGYCAAWYSRRFFNAVTVSVEPSRHSGMGLDCYVQWSSPIRRYGDLQVS